MLTLQLDKITSQAHEVDNLNLVSSFFLISQLDIWFFN